MVTNNFENFDLNYNIISIENLAQSYKFNSC